MDDHSVGYSAPDILEALLTLPVLLRNRYIPGMEGFTPADIKRIMAVTDAEKIHRMSLVIPLAPEGRGSVRIEGRKLTIVPPAEGDFEEWLAALPEKIRSLDLSGVQRTP